MSIVIAVAILVINFLLPHRVRLIGVALLLVPQLYLPGIPVSVAFLWTAMTCLAGLIARGRPRADSAVVVLMLLFLAAVALSFLWALPSGYNDGITITGRGLLFLLWLREVIVLGRSDPGLLDSIVTWMAPGVAVQSALAIIFRLVPAWEEMFLRSQIAPFLVGPSARNLYTFGLNNVLDAEKSGGFFVNGNIAALFGGIASLVLLVAARRTSHRWLYVIAGLAAFGCVFTGSKAGVILLLLCAILITTMPFLVKRSAALVGLSIALVAPLAYFAGLRLLEWLMPAFYARTDYALMGRGALWARAADLFEDSPILGVGFGGWMERVGLINGQVRPPHNVLIATWAYSGIIALAVAIVFMVAALGLALRVAASQPNLRDCRTAVIALCAISWMFLQSMGENTALYGEPLSMILFGLAFGYLYAMKPPPRQVTRKSSAATTYARTAEELRT